MGFGANVAVSDAEEASRDELATVIAEGAARLVAAGDMGRDDAIKSMVNFHQQERAADDDPTGVLGVELKAPTPSKTAPDPQVKAIATELLDSAQDAVHSMPK